ncbi:MAG: hypothetical protein MI723_00590 [Caulobacterales bacterium]|nr:hypothetical protein [Caulobacterales bacterium]
MPPSEFDPRLLLIDMTPMSGTAATSTLKRAYFGDWDKDALLHVMAGEAGLLMASDRKSPPQPFWPSEDAVSRLVGAFRPQVVLYRPLEDSPELHRFARVAINQSDAALALWIMDDWPERLRLRSASAYTEMDAELRRLLARSEANFAISEGMAAAFGERYGVPFAVARNGVVKKEWRAKRRRRGGCLRLRYAGSLAPDTTLESVRMAARAVARLRAAGRRISFEIRSQPYWFDRYGESLGRFPGTFVRRAEMTPSTYRSWLSRADVTLIAYNFDDTTRRYLRYSVANKVPEALASGAAVLAFGPSDIETMALLRAADGVTTINRPDIDAVERTLAMFIDQPAARLTLGAAARAFAFAHFDLGSQKRRLHRSLRAIAAGEIAREAADRLVGGDQHDVRPVLREPPSAAAAVDSLGRPRATVIRRIIWWSAERWPRATAAILARAQRIKSAMAR